MYVPFNKPSGEGGYWEFYFLAETFIFSILLFIFTFIFPFLFLSPIIIILEL